MDKKYSVIEVMEPKRLWVKATTGKQALQLKYKLEQRFPEKTFKIEIGGN